MLVLVSIQFVILLVAGVVLGLESHTGRLEGKTPRATTLRAALFLAAAIGGAVLLITLAESEWLLALALAPISVLSLVRFTMLAQRWWRGWRLTVFTALCLTLGTVALLPWMPYPLDRTYILRSLDLMDGAAIPPDTIDPEATRPVRA